jgi:glycosyltransferase involved in cell wall biosynthesis
MKQKVLLTTLNFKGGGAEKIFTSLIENLCNDFDLVVVTFSNEGRHADVIQKYPVTYYNLSGSSNNTLLYILRLRKIIKQEKPLSILAFLYYPIIISFFARLGLKTDLIPSERSNYRLYLNKSLKHKLYYFILKRCYAGAKRVGVLTQHMKQQLISDFGVKENRISVIYNGINFNKLDNAYSPNEIKYTFRPDITTLIAVGRLTLQKNYPLLLKAFHSFCNKYENSELLILGDGDNEKELKQMAKNLGIDKKVFFLGYCNNPVPYLKHSRCYILSSNWEGFPNALIEAMYANGHVISTDCPTGPSEIITHNVDGILCPIDNAETLAQAMGKMSFDEPFRQMVYKNSRSKVMAFSEQQMIEAYRNLLKPSISA